MVAIVSIVGWLLLFGGSGRRNDLVWHAVHYDRLQLSIVERGALESASNCDIVCRVKAKAQGSTVSTTIKWVIDDGSIVQVGDKLMELDDSALQEQLSTQQITVDTARAAYVTASENYKIVESQNVSDQATAELTLALAKIDLEKYLNGDYEQSKKDIEGRLMIARSDLEMWEERAAWSDRMSRPGRRYVTDAQAKADFARKLSAVTALKKIEEELRVLEDPGYGLKARTIKDLRGKIAEAERAMDRVQKQAIAKEAQADADRKAKLSIFNKEQTKLMEIEDELRKCYITAPQAGLVVYYVPEQSRWGGGSRQSLIAQGEPVSEGQKLMRIPDLTNMQVNTRVHEAMVSRVHGDRWVHTGFSDGVRATMLFALDPLGRVLVDRTFQDAASAFTEMHRDKELRLAEQGLPATVRVESFPDRALKAHVKSVGTVASKQDWLSSDVKVYQTMVSIDEPVDNLRPDMSAEVTILTDTHLSHVLTVPIQALFGTAEMGHKRFCFVKAAEGTERREVEVGLSNDTMVEIRQGLAEGDQVVLNPRSLMSDQEKSSMNTEEPGGRGKGKGKGKGRDKDKGPAKDKGGKEKGGFPGKDGPGAPGGPGGAMSREKAG